MSEPGLLIADTDDAADAAVEAGAPSAATAAPRALRTDALADSVALLLIMTVAQRAVGFLRGVLFCRWLTPEQLGQWDLCWGFLLMAAPVAVLGLPGSFGRFAEHYCHRGQLRSFLRRIALSCTVLLALAVTGLLVTAPWVSQLFFGDTNHSALVRLLAVAVLAVVAHNAMESLFAGLRMYRVTSCLQGIHGFAFAGLSLLLLWLWQPRVDAVVLGFALACTLTSCLALWVLRGVWREVPENHVAAPASDMWRRVLPFALWLWVTNWLFCLFELGDRFMIVHFSGLSAADSLNMVGQYHSSRVVPLLFVGLAEMLTALVLPYLSADWEAGRHGNVSRHVNLTLKLAAFVLTAGSIVVLLLAPLLFGVLLQGKYDAGHEVLPLILIFCVWAGMNALASNYLMCAERAQLNCLMLVVALAVNLGLNLVLLPRFGLWGVVMATAAARLCALGLMYLASARHGMHLERSMLLLTVLPALLYCGPWLAAGALLAIVVVAVRTEWVLSTSDKEELLAVAERYRRRAMKLLERGKPA